MLTTWTSSSACTELFWITGAVWPCAACPTTPSPKSGRASSSRTQARCGRGRSCGIRSGASPRAGHALCRRLAWMPEFSSEQWSLPFSPVDAVPDLLIAAGNSSIPFPNRYGSCGQLSGPAAGLFGLYLLSLDRPDVGFGAFVQLFDDAPGPALPIPTRPGVRVGLGLQSRCGT